MFFVYAIQNLERKKIYIGYTINLENRLKRHNGLLTNKRTSFTNKNRGQWELVYFEKFENRKEAINREKQLKSYRGRQFIKEKI